MSKRILFLSYWSADEPLTESTIVPYLRLMSGMQAVEYVLLVTVERGGTDTIGSIKDLAGVEHIGIHTRFRRFPLLSKVDLFLRLPFILAKMVRLRKIDLLDAKASLAGGIAHLVSRLTGVPYLVESFEPHSDYMVDSGVWPAHGPFQYMMRLLEGEQIKHAAYLVTVTHNYKDKLLSSGVPTSRIKIIPSVVNVEHFAFDVKNRREIREQLQWQNAIVGVYAGKFGGLYYDKEAFEIFALARKILGPDFRLLLLTNEPSDKVRSNLESVGFPVEHSHVCFVPHEEVARWLSAADLAFSTIRHIPSGLFQSPVKNGEYWANGLPIMLTTGVSDDHRIILREPWAGAVYDLAKPGSVEAALRHMSALLQAGVDRERIMSLAREHRGMHIARRVYSELFDQGSV